MHHSVAKLQLVGGLSGFAFELNMMALYKYNKALKTSLEYEITWCDSLYAIRIE